MKTRRRTRPRKAQPPSDFDQMAKLVMLGANIYHAGTKSAAPPSVEPQPFTFSSNRRPVGKSQDGERLPEV